MKRIVSNSEPLPRILTSSILVKVFGAVVGVALAIVSAMIWAPSWAFEMILLYVLFFFFQVFITFHHYFLTKSQGHYDAIWKTLVLFLIAFLKVYLIFSHFGWKAFVVVSSLELLIFGLVYIFTFYRYKDFKMRFEFDLDSFKSLLLNSLPIFLFLLFDQALLRVDQVMIGNLLSDAELGQYAVASKLVNLWNFVPIIVLSTLFPVMVKSFHLSSTEFYSLTQKVIGGFFFISILFGLVVTLISEPLISSLYGEGFAQAVPILQLYAWFPLFNFFVLFRAKIFTVTGELRLAILVSLTVLLINIMVNFLLIPQYGAVGAVYSSMLSILTVSLAFSFLSKTIRVTNIQFLKSLYRAPMDFMSLLKLF